MASPVDTSVKLFKDDLPGAPVLNGVVGAGISLLDACLVTGFGLRTAVSLVVSGGVATMTLASNTLNGNLVDTVVLVDGVTGSLTALNGEQRVISASSTTLSYATAAADGTATGTITVKTAPAGWSKVYSGTNKAAYRATDVTGNRFYLRVDDTATLHMTVRGWETMTDVDTGTSAFPTVAEYASGLYWSKSTVANSNANKWDFIADSRSFVYAPMSGYGASASAAGQGCYFFGDFVSFKSVDPYSSCLSGSSSAPSSTSSAGSIASNNSNVHNLRIVRSYTGLGSTIVGHLSPASGAISTSAISGADAQFGTYPPVVDGAVRVSRQVVLQGAATGASAIPRGQIPGFYWIPHTLVESSFQRGDKVTSTADLSSRKLYVLQTSAGFTDNNTSAGRTFLDITGPWR
jgi:hypothetical protein